MDFHPGAIIFGIIFVAAIVVINLLKGKTTVEPMKAETDDKARDLSRATAGVPNRRFMGLAAANRRRRR